ncbi:MAG: NAD(P)H-binding protein [Solirubrobacteraceae bacterium]|nr:NAD(P)H-binding protein [Solirubrobacteraceae bacterium]
MIAVFGGSGTIGSQVVRELAARGADLRLLTRSPQAQVGIPAVYADPTVPASLGPALVGAERLFLLTPHGPGQPGMEQALLAAAVQAGVQGIVKISGTSASIGPNGPTATAVTHFHSERAIEDSGLEFCHIRPAFLMQNLLETVAPIVRTRGLVATPMAGAPIAMVDARDVGAVAAHRLLADRLGDTSIRVSGPAAVTHRDLARQLGVPCLPVPVALARKALRAGGADDWELDHAIRMVRFFNSGADAAVSDAVRLELGRPPRALEDFIGEHRGDFGGAQESRRGWRQLLPTSPLREER